MKEQRMSTFVRPRVGAGARTLAAHWYLSPEVFAQERERLFAGGWTCIGREEHIAAPGDFILVDVAAESIIVTRDAHGTARAFFNVCRHRGTQLCSAARGRF
jgi:Rieske 2Fe-2S family protein